MIDQDLKFSTEYSYRIKLLVLGAKQSGKSSLIYTYKHDAPPMHKISSQQTDAIIKKIKYIKANKEGYEKQHFECNIHLWDTTAQQSPDIFRQILLKRVNAIMLVFDRQSRSSFEKTKAIWAQIVEPRKKLYHVEVILVGNIKGKQNLSPSKEGDNFLNTSIRQGFGGINRRKNMSLLEEEFIRNQRNDIVMQSQNLANSRRKNSFRRSMIEPFDDHEDFTHEINYFQETEKCEYFEISVHSPEAVRQVFQGLLGKIMKNIEEGKISLQDAIIKDTQGKIKLRKFDFKTYEYFQKRYNRCC